ncbi:MAG TPA: RraA family protein [Vicinamibacteria bacterium]|nr:RraA family protein [Vicinamibacteria bacterium]
MRTIAVAALAGVVLGPAGAGAQSIAPSREEVVALTAGWKGERFPDGRPKVPDALLERMKNVNLEEAWSVLRGKGFEWQFEGRFKHVHLDQTAVMVGRALTATFVPKRPDLDEALTTRGHAEGRVGGRNSWPIDMLQKGDVYVANSFGAYEGGPIIGGNLSTAIFKNSQNGIVFDGSVRDIAQMETIEGFKAWVRDWHPSYNYDNMLVEINRPARIGTALCLPGDVVLATRAGVMFIPPQLAELVVKTGELVQLRDMFGFQRIKEGVYTPGQIDQRWSDDMERDFSKWLSDHIDKLPVPREQIQELLKERTW